MPQRNPRDILVAENAVVREFDVGHQARYPDRFARHRLREIDQPRPEQAPVADDIYLVAVNIREQAEKDRVFNIQVGPEIPAMRI